MIEVRATTEGIYVFHASEGSEEVIAILSEAEVRVVIRKLTNALFDYTALVKR